MKLKIRGISYYFEIHQEKSTLPDLVLLHGFMGSGKALTPILDSLKSFCNPITIDLMGHGKSEGAELHYRFSTKEQVADLSKLISEQLRIPLYLYGYSMGGRLALQLALHRPDLFKGLILESATYGIENESERQARQSLDARRSDQIMGNFSGFLKEWSQKPLFQSPGQNTEASVLYSSIQKEQNPLWMANTLQGFGTGTMPCVKEEISELPVPVQLLTGQEDSKFVQIGQLMNKIIPDSRLQIVQQAGHRVHLEQPEEVSKTIQTFLNST